MKPMKKNNFKRNSICNPNFYLMKYLDVKFLLENKINGKNN